MLSDVTMLYSTVSESRQAIELLMYNTCDAMNGLSESNQTSGRVKCHHRLERIL